MSKEMAKTMTDDEVKRCMAILVEDSIVLSISRDIDHNSINVKFRVAGYDRNRELKLRIDCEYLYE